MVGVQEERRSGGRYRPRVLILSRNRNTDKGAGSTSISLFHAQAIPEDFRSRVRNCLAAGRDASGDWLVFPG